MSTNVRRGRHRADHAPHTPLTALSKSAAHHARKGALVAAASGIIATTLSSTASAAPDGARHTHVAELEELRQETTREGLERASRGGIRTAPAVQVAPDAQLEVAAAAIEVTPAPEPEPAPVVAEPAVTQVATTQPLAGQAATSATPVSYSSDGSIGAQAVAIAMQHVGTPYAWGGEAPGGFDCSGLVVYSYGQLGVSLPHSSSALLHAGTQVSAAEARPGDLVWTPGHIAIYAGNGMVVEAVSYSTPLSYRAMWQDNPVFVRVA